MVMQHDYASTAPTRADIDAMPGASVIEFGTGWCGHCTTAQPLIATAFEGHPDLRHFKVEDGPGRRLGRSFHVKLWPTLVFLRDGEEVARLVRPSDGAAIKQAMEAIDAE
ncbi:MULTISPECIES: thioredoxin family protein [unclassified Lysobacter]